MLTNQAIKSESQQTYKTDQSKFRKPYQKTKLEKLGDLRSMTLGSSFCGNPDTGGSGGGLFERDSSCSTAPNRMPGQFHK